MIILKKKHKYMSWKMLINSTGGILSHCTHVSNHHMGSLNFTIVCVKYTPLKLEKIEKNFKDISEQRDWSQVADMYLNHICF